MSQPCPRFPTKVQHRTREDALEHQKQLVFRDASTGRSDKSRGLNVYPCQHCGAWHVGHVESLPLVWHYSTCSMLDAILESGALQPSNPRAFVPDKELLEDEKEEYLEGSFDIAAIPLSRSFQNRYRRGLPKWVDVPIPNSKRHVRIPRTMIERERLLWFSRNEYWEHSIDDPDRQSLELGGEGLLRFGVAPSVAKLRWSDYLARNKTHPVMRQYFACRADPTEWLATDEAVPLDHVKRIEVYYGGVWTAIEEVDDEAFERYLEERPAVYDAAHKSLKVKMDQWKTMADAPSRGPARPGRSHDDLLRFFEMMATDMRLTEVERIALEDSFLLMAQVQKGKTSV